MRNEELLRLNTPEQNEQAIIRCFLKNDVDKAFELLENGMTITASMLNFLLFEQNCSGDFIKDFINHGKKFDTYVPVWINTYFEIEHRVAIAKKHPKLVLYCFSDEECVQQQLWDVLLLAKKYKLLCLDAPQIIEQHIADKDVAKVAIEYDFNRYAPLVFEHNHYDLILNKPLGHKYLLEHNMIDYVTTNAREEHVFEYIVDYYGEDKFFENHNGKMLLRDGAKLLNSNTWFVEWFFSKYIDTIDWEYIWEKEIMGHYELMHVATDNMFDLKCLRFLWRHKKDLWQYWEWCRSWD